MRFIRLIFVAALALVLVAVALANRDMVTLSAFRPISDSTWAARGR